MRVLIATAIAAVIFFAQTACSDSFLSEGIVGLGTIGILGLVLALGVYAIIVAFTWNKWAIKTTVWLALAILPALVLSMAYSNWQEARTVADGNRIVQAVGEFKNRTGHQPTTLFELEPAYLEKIPMSSMGWNEKEFGYRNENGYFTLSFALPAWMVKTYDSRSGKWEDHD